MNIERVWERNPRKNDYKMNHAKKHKDTQVDYITVIDHSTLKKEIKTLLEIKVDDKVTLDDVIRKT